MSWTDELRLARVRRARRRIKRGTSRPCPQCLGIKSVCSACGNMYCAECSDHATRCKHPTAPPTRKTAVRRTIELTIPEEARDQLERFPIPPITILPITDAFIGFHVTFAKPTADPAASLVDKLIKPHLTKDWHLFGSGAQKAGTFYIDLEKKP